MRKEKALIAMLRGLVDLLDEEAGRNPKFAENLDNILAPLPKQRAVAKKKVKSEKEPVDIPDIYAIRHSLGEAEFRLWLRDQPVETLRALIRKHDLDATRRTARWKDDPEKLSGFIADQLQSRLARGSSFLRGNDSYQRKTQNHEP